MASIHHRVVHSLINRRLTTGVRLCFLRRVRLIRNIVVILLLALWLPTTQHCSLEAAGLFAPQEAPAKQIKCCGAQEKACAEDPCELLESGDYRPASAQLNVPIPSFTVCACLFCVSVEQVLILPNADAATARVSFDWPEDCSPTWHIMQRAALSPRAPSLAVA